MSKNIKSSPAKSETQSDKDWEKTLNSKESQDWLEEMTQKALADFEAGNTTPVSNVKNNE